MIEYQILSKDKGDPILESDLCEFAIGGWKLVAIHPYVEFGYNAAAGNAGEDFSYPKVQFIFMRENLPDRDPLP